MQANLLKMERKYSSIYLGSNKQPTIQLLYWYSNVTPRGLPLHVFEEGDYKGN